MFWIYIWHAFRKGGLHHVCQALETTADEQEYASAPDPMESVSEAPAFEKATKATPKVEEEETDEEEEDAFAETNEQEEDR